MWDAKSRETNIERVNRNVSQTTQSLLFFLNLNIICVKATVKQACLCALVLTLRSQ